MASILLNRAPFLSGDSDLRSCAMHREEKRESLSLCKHAFSSSEPLRSSSEANLLSLLSTHRKLVVHISLSLAFLGVDGTGKVSGMAGRH